MASANFVLLLSVYVAVFPETLYNKGVDGGENVKKTIRHMIDTYLNNQLDLRVRIFNVMAASGMTVSFVSTVSAVTTGNPWQECLMYLAFALLSAGLLWFATKTGRFQLCYGITIAAIFMGGFSAFFLLGGGYYGSMPYFFVFAVVFTIFMLQGKTAIIMAVIELALYSALCLYRYHNLNIDPVYFESESILYETLFGFILVAAALGITMFIQLRLYNGQQKTLDEQNKALGRINQMKTELFANVSHEMKTPLTVISVHIQRAEAIMKLGGETDSEKVYESFALVQEEIMRLSRIVGGALAVSSMQELSRSNAAISVAEILHSSTTTYRAISEKYGNTLTLTVADTLPTIAVSADALVQMTANLLSNANAHTKDGEIKVLGEYDGTILKISVKDNGDGIEPTLLPKVFDRGVTDGSGSGYGLAICREVARSYGGDVNVVSEHGKGTTATITLPAEPEGNIYG